MSQVYIQGGITVGTAGSRYGGVHVGLYTSGSYRVHLRSTLHRARRHALFRTSEMRRRQHCVPLYQGHHARAPSPSRALLRGMYYTWAAPDFNCISMRISSSPCAGPTSLLSSCTYKRVHVPVQHATSSI